MSAKTIGPPQTKQRTSKQREPPSRRIPLDFIVRVVLAPLVKIQGIGKDSMVGPFGNAFESRNEREKAADRGEPYPKGERLGSCNRTACQCRGGIVEWFNHATKKYYCCFCAQKINEANRKEAMELYGHDLCIKI